ncbi:RNA polymerase sigma factor [Phenylobacterium sp.]|jgi:RNA polymerase sigma-70 factor (ECF subfamily)|uniref:RNA polymerase sigma factor n=1 Tax=Phenylobacterium sp. TaxID=1871053 RepID=UPI002F4148E9
MLDESRLAELLSAIAGGDGAAAGELYGLIGGRLHGQAQRILRDPGLAEDAVQEAFLKIWRNAWRFDAGKGAASAWMSVIGRRVALDRRPRAAAVALPELEAPSVDPDYVHPRLRESLAELPDLHRKALVLMYVYGLSHSELAAAMNAPLGTVKSWVRRASAALKGKLER